MEVGVTTPVDCVGVGDVWVRVDVELDINPQPVRLQQQTRRPPNDDSHVESAKEVAT